MLTVGLTGGIGCGKTTVSRLFEAKGIPVIDADVIAHAIVQKGEPALTLLTNTFGKDILSPDGSLNRDNLREIVFTRPTEKKKLENILHPLIYHSMFQQLGLSASPYGILSIPLLFETNHQSKVGRTLVIDCSEETQMSRVRSRDQLSDEMINSIMQSQCSRSFRRSHADDILNNNNTLANLEKDVDKLHASYLEMSAGKNDKHPAK